MTGDPRSDDVVCADANIVAVDDAVPRRWHLKVSAPIRGVRGGHHVELRSRQGVRRYFSVASRPVATAGDAVAFDLIVEAAASDRGTSTLIAEVEEHARIAISGPFGSAVLCGGSPDGHHVFVAYDSGYAYIRGLLDELRHEHPGASAALFRFRRRRGQTADAPFIDAVKGGLRSFSHVEVAGIEDWPGDPARFVLERLEPRDGNPEIAKLYIGGSGQRTRVLIQGLIDAGIPSGVLVSDHLA